MPSHTPRGCAPADGSYDTHSLRATATGPSGRRTRPMRGRASAPLGLCCTHAGRSAALVHRHLFLTGGERVKRFFGWSALVFGVASLGCLLAFWPIGSTVDEAGVLHEPFALIPLAWLCGFLAAAAGITYVVLRLVGSSSKRAERTPQG